MYEAVATAAGVYASGGYFVVVDTVLRPRFLGIVAETIEPRDIAVHYAMLRPSWPATLLRSHGRDAGARHEDALLEHMYAYFDNLGALERHAIDTTEQDPAQTVDTIREMLRRGAARLTAV